MTLHIDRRIYPDSCISKVVYWLSEQYTMERHSNGDEEIIDIDTDVDEQSFRKLFFERLNDYKLRGVIEAETKDIRTILYAKAFGDFDELTEEDITA